MEKHPHGCQVTSICKELGIPLRGPNPGAEELGQACEALGLKSDLPMWDCIKQCREKIGQGTVLPMLLQEKLKLVHGALPSSKPETEWHCTAESLKEAAEMCGISIGWFTRDNWHTVMDLCLEFLGKAGCLRTLICKFAKPASPAFPARRTRKSRPSLPARPSKNHQRGPESLELCSRCCRANSGIQASS